MAANRLGVFEFTSNAGKVIDEGVATWPHCLYVNIPRRQLLEFIRQAAAALDRNEDLQISMMGELVPDQFNKNTAGSTPPAEPRSHS